MRKPNILEKTNLTVLNFKYIGSKKTTNKNITGHLKNSCNLYIKILYQYVTSIDLIKQTTKKVPDLDLLGFPLKTKKSSFIDHVSVFDFNKLRLSSSFKCFFYKIPFYDSKFVNILCKNNLSKFFADNNSFYTKNFNISSGFSSSSDAFGLSEGFPFPYRAGALGTPASSNRAASLPGSSRTPGIEGARRLLRPPANEGAASPMFFPLKLSIVRLYLVLRGKT
ncbi:MAG: hypothetical protein ACT6RN_26770 [Agrobacterium sp.]|uniref:hypothetical protein n=1 Tax=Agrobacterium sp. TaxID=361 RepID=UPI004038372C